MGAAAVVDLDEVEVPVDEVEPTVPFLVSGKAYTDAPCMTIARATGVITSVAIDASLQAQ